MRTCRLCHEEKPLDDFWKVNKNRGGRDYACADCRNEQRRNREGARYEPTITRGLEVKANGLYPMYWERD